MFVLFHFLFPKSHQVSTKQRTAFEALEVVSCSSFHLSLLRAISRLFFLPKQQRCFLGDCFLITVSFFWAAREWELCVSLSLSFRFLPFLGILNKTESVDSAWRLVVENSFQRGKTERASYSE